ncbi:MAG: hypothetical protein K2L67_04330 [Clostridia bacterium]|nr:hypothetical protein [Clostridia bacterium]
MKFKHTFHVFVDNFGITYKQLLYRLVVLLAAGIVLYFSITPFINGFLPELNNLISNAVDFALKLLNGKVDELTTISVRVQEAYAAFIDLIHSKTTDIVVVIIIFTVIYLIAAFLNGLGNYAAATCINDKMALRANSPFLSSLIKNLKQAAAFNAIYVPLTFLYEAAVAVAMFFFVFYLINSIVPFFVCVFLFVLIIVFSAVLKYTFTCDWLPAIIRGKMGPLKALKYTFSIKRKDTLSVLSNFIVLVLIIFGVNVAAFFCTLGVGLLITVPSSAVLIAAFYMVNYYDREEIKYFVDQNTIIKPAKEHTPTREEFFRGADE